MNSSDLSIRSSRSAVCSCNSSPLWPLNTYISFTEQRKASFLEEEGVEDILCHFMATQFNCQLEDGSVEWVEFLILIIILTIISFGFIISFHFCFPGFRVDIHHHRCSSPDAFLRLRGWSVTCLMTVSSRPTSSVSRRWCLVVAVQESWVTSLRELITPQMYLDANAKPAMSKRSPVVVIRVTTKVTTTVRQLTLMDGRLLSPNHRYASANSINNVFSRSYTVLFASIITFQKLKRTVS